VEFYIQNLNSLFLQSRKEYEKNSLFDNTDPVGFYLGFVASVW